MSLGKLGYHTIRCYTSESPEELADLFCKANRIGPKTKKEILKIIQNKFDEFGSYKIEYIWQSLLK